jgi:hypothetical protein
MWPMLEIAEQSFHGKVMMLITFNSEEGK